MNGILFINRSAVRVIFLTLLYKLFFFENLISLDDIKSYKEDKVKGKEVNPKEEKKKSDIFQKLSVLKKLYNIIIYTHSSAGYIREFKSLIGRRIPLNNYIR